MTEATAGNGVAANVGNPAGLNALNATGYFLICGICPITGGGLASKAIWIAICGIVLATGSYHVWLCEQLNKRFESFGGVERGTLFILSGVIPALLGGALLGTLLYARPAASSRSLEPSG